MIVKKVLTVPRAGAALVTIGDCFLALSDRLASRESPCPQLLRPVESRPDGSGGVVSVDAPLVGEGADDVQSVVPGRVDHSLVPGAAIVFDFDPGIEIRMDCGPDGDSATGETRSAVLGSVRRQFGGAEDRVVCPWAVLEHCAQVGAHNADLVGAAGVGDVGGA